VRITSGMMKDNYLKCLNRNMASMVGLQYKMATGKRLNKMSDDPVDAMSVMQFRVKLYRNEQYRQSVESGLTWLQQTESSVSELNELLKSAYEAVIQMSNDFLGDDDKGAAAELIGQLRDHVLTIGNAQSGAQYIFGGHNTKKAPFSADGSGKPVYNGLDLTDDTNPALIEESETNIAYEVGFNLRMNVSVNGVQLLGMGDDNIYTMLDNLYNALKGGASADELTVYAGELQNAQSHVLSVLGDIGGRVNRLELISNRYEEDKLMYTDIKSKLEEVDQAEALMNFKIAEYVYNAALQVGSKIVQPSLVDFLK
jgi:flagellar hook-associated protein 3 FlgL